MTVPESSRATLVAILIAIPAILAALGFIGEPPPRDDGSAASSLADAILARDVERAYTFIRAGEDPNARLRVRNAELTGDRDIMVSPLLLAVASNSDNTVNMLLSFGARLDLPANRFAVCLARRLGYEDIVRALERDAGQASRVECPEPGPGPPLVAYAE